MEAKAETKQPDLDLPDQESYTTLVHRLRSHLNERPDRTAFIVPKALGRKRTLRHPIRGVPIFDYEKKSQEETALIVVAMMAVLEEMGVKSGDRVAILSWNRAEWVWLADAIWALSGIVVGIDPRYSQEQVSGIINDASVHPEMPDTALKIVVCEDQSQADKVGKLDKNIKVFLIPELMSWIYGYDQIRSHKWQHSMSTICLGKKRLFWRSPYSVLVNEILRTYASRLDPNQIAMLWYTSGTSTGIPKGDIHTHRTLAYAGYLLGGHVELNDDDIFFGQLPASHVLTWNGQLPCLWYGTAMFLCRPDRVEEMEQHMKNVHATIMFGVSKLWDRIMDMVKTAPKLKVRFVPEWAFLPINKPIAMVYSAIINRAFNPQSGLDRQINRYVSNQLSTAMGGNLRLLMVGGSAFDPELDRNFQALGFKIDVGYGLTETLGGASVEREGARMPGSSGKPLPLIKFTFLPLPEADPDIDQSLEAGILVIEGPTVSPGYWNRPKETAKAFPVPGKFNTGDVGYLKDGFFYFLYRWGDNGKKLFNGEFVSEKEILNLFLDNPLIQHTIKTKPDVALVIEKRNFVTAVIFLNERGAWEYLEQHGLLKPGDCCSMEFLSQHKGFKEVLRTQIAAINKQLKGKHKRILNFVIANEAATIQNRMVSGKMEFSPRAAATHFAPEIDQMYKDGPLVGL